MTALDAATQALVEQRNEYRRRVEIAAAFVADMACVCRGDSECWRCFLQCVLAGDE